MKMLALSVMAFVSVNTFASSDLKSDLPVIVGEGSTLVSRGNNEFCSFAGSNYVYRFITTNSTKFKNNIIRHVEISKKGSKNNAVARYDLIGLNETIDPGSMGTIYRVFELKNNVKSMPKYFYHATNFRYVRDKHFFANEVNVATGKPEILEVANFHAEVGDYGDEFLCGY